MFYVYLILNYVNGKIYIGKTNNLQKRWIDHLRVSIGGKNKYPRKYSLIHKAIVKYGKNNFEMIRLQSFYNEDCAYKAEKYWINFYNSRNCKFGYNLAEGGKGSGSGILSPNFGLKRSESTINKLIKSHLGNKNINFGKSFSQETKNKMSVSQTGNQSGENSPKSILNWEIVNKIREIYKEGKSSLTELSIVFNTHRTNIYSIVKNKTWKNE